MSTVFYNVNCKVYIFLKTTRKSDKYCCHNLVTRAITICEAIQEKPRNGAIEKSLSLISKYWKNKHFEDKSNIILIFWLQIVFVWIDIIIVKLCT